MRNLFLVLGTVILILAVGVGGFLIGRNTSFESAGEEIVSQIARPLEKYAFKNLKEMEILPGEFSKEEDIFTFEFSPNLDPKKTKKMTGQIKLPEESEGTTPAGKYPLVVMIRGYVDQEIYQTGVGTVRAAQIFSENGFITLSPDFLGYGGSDIQSEDVMEARFQSYTTVLALLNSLNSSSFTQITEGKWDGQNIFLWAHSNGGQIAITILELTGEAYPTTLWAPVTKPFPYSILYYTDEAEDKGKYLRNQIAKFEALYDANLYSIDNYFDQLNKETPIQLHQGLADDAIPVDWSNQFIKILENEGLENLNYFIYPGADHNLQPSWDVVVARDLAFFKQNIENKMESKIEGKIEN